MPKAPEAPSSTPETPSKQGPEAPTPRKSTTASLSTRGSEAQYSGPVAAAGLLAGTGAAQERHLTGLPDSPVPITQSPPIDLRAYLRVLWRRKWLLLAVVILVPMAAYLYSARSPNVYQASILMEIQPPSGTSLPNTQNSVPSDQTGVLSDQSVAIAARLIQTSGVAQAAARRLSLSQSAAASLLGDITVSPDVTTGFITVTASAPSPRRAADLANAFGAAVNSVQTKQAIGRLNEAISGIVSQLGALPPNARTARGQLSAQLQNLRALRAAQGGNAQIIQPASAPRAPSSPRPVRAALLALLVAVLIGLGLVALVELLDQRVRQPEDFEELIGLSVLSSIPRSAFKGGTQSPIVAEAFRSLRASLDFFNVDRDVRSIVVAGGRKGDGKTLVSLGLARAYALAGRDVILLDGDLRRPMIASRLKLKAGTGLAGVLAGDATLADELQEISVRGREGSRLRVLAAGRSPSNPSELLGSGRMRRLLEQLDSICDLVIIDTSPLLAVSDALPLLESTSGTLLVVRLGVTQRRDLRHLRKLLDASEGLALGTVVTGASERGAYPNEYYLLDYQTPSGSLNGGGRDGVLGGDPQGLTSRDG